MRHSHPVVDHDGFTLHGSPMLMQLAHTDGVHCAEQRASTDEEEKREAESAEETEKAEAEEGTGEEAEVEPAAEDAEEESALEGQATRR